MPLTLEPDARLDALVTAMRVRHADIHGPTSVAGYCAELPGITSGYCEMGLLIEALERAEAEIARLRAATTNEAGPPA